MDGLTKIQVKMQKLAATTKGVGELENYHYGEQSQWPPQFYMWPVVHFCVISHKLSDLCRQTLFPKCTVAEDLTHNIGWQPHPELLVDVPVPTLCGE